jgi:hopene-associated glycosyltransferase HpnB
VLVVLAAVPVLIWLYLLIGRGGFWRISKNLAARNFAPPPDVRVVAVIPARNEAAVIGEALESLRTQTFAIVVVDDGSEDATTESARATGVQVLRAPAPPAGWTGKLWALSLGVEEALQFDPDYLLLTDADIRHERQNVASLVSLAEERHLDLCSYMVKLCCDSWAEKAFLPAFVYFFFTLYPPAWATGAAGGCILIRPQALAGIGGLAAIRGEIIDDCALAKAVKARGGSIWLGLTTTASSIRSYGGIRGVKSMIARNAFSQLRHSTLLLAGTAAGLLLTYVLPVCLVAFAKGWPRVLGGGAWLLMSASYLPMVRFYKRSWLWSVTLPFVALFYLDCTFRSALAYWRGMGGEWKGRAQDRAAS